MIWLWIIIAVILSVLPLIKKGISPQMFMLLLLPVDAYGISVFGATIKPYMIYTVIMLLLVYIKNKGTDYNPSVSMGQLNAGIICCLMLAVNLINSDSAASVKSAFMAIIVYLCAQITTSLTDKSTTEKLGDVFIASCFGFGIVYIIAFIVMRAGFDISSLVAITRESPGIFLKQSDMMSGELINLYRLRGFSYDPNTIYINFLFGLSACTLKLFRKLSWFNIITMIICISNIIISGSRMGLICCGVCILLSCIAGVQNYSSVKKQVVTICIAVIIISAFFAFLATDSGMHMLSKMLSTYTNRSGLNESHGRFTIWREALRVFWSKNPIIGIGLSNMATLTNNHLMSHNTWIELLCECGIIVGGLAIVYFVVTAIVGWMRIKQFKAFDNNKISVYSMLIGYTLTIIALISVDNFTCSYLWFGALMLLKITRSGNDIYNEATDAPSCLTSSDEVSTPTQTTSES